MNSPVHNEGSLWYFHSGLSSAEGTLLKACASPGLREVATRPGRSTGPLGLQKCQLRPLLWLSVIGSAATSSTDYLPHAICQLLDSSRTAEAEESRF
jgi:hypothetical protein